MAKLTEAEFLALPAREQNRHVIEALCGREVGGPMLDLKYVDGDGNALCEVWAALPRDAGQEWALREAAIDGRKVIIVGDTHKEVAEVVAETFPRTKPVVAPTCRLAVCVAYLKALGVVE